MENRKKIKNVLFYGSILLGAASLICGASWAYLFYNMALSGAAITAAGVSAIESGAVITATAVSTIESVAVVATAATSAKAVIFGATSFGTGVLSAGSGIANYCLPAPA